MIVGGPTEVIVTNLGGWAGWTFTLGRDKHGTITSLRVQTPPGERLTADHMKRVPAGMLLRMAGETVPGAASVAAQLVPDPAGLRAYSSEHLAAVVLLYRTALGLPVAAGGVPRSPRAVIADHFGVSRVTVDRWLARARRDGLLGSWADERAQHENVPRNWNPKELRRGRKP